MKGTYSRHKTNTTGQLHGLEDRMTDKQFERRTAKIATRVGREGAVTRGMTMGIIEVLRRGFFGRLKWLLLGR